MEITLKKSKTFEAKIYMGSRHGYHGPYFGKFEVIHALQKYDMKISMRITETMFCVSNDNYVEQGFEIAFIQYPRYLRTEEELRLVIRDLADYLLVKFHQNRITVVFPDETEMFESEDAEE